MRRYFILLISLLVVASLLSTIGATSETTSLVARSVTGDQVDAVAKRLLRGEAAVDEGDDIDRGEERGLVLPGVVQKLKSIFQNAKAKVWQLRVEIKFRSLQLEKGSLSSSEMKMWVDSVTNLYKNDPEKSTKAMLTTLTRHYDEITLMRWAHTAMDSSDMGILGHKLQSAQFTKLMYRGYDALGLAKRLRTTAGGDNQQDKLIVQAFAAFVKQRRQSA